MKQGVEVLELILRRKPSSEKCTIGELFNGEGYFLCYTLEDVIREMPGLPVSQWKVPGSTAIPQGRYRITITPSERFGRPLPLLNMVPGFGGIRIHPGNTSEDTEGCILPGMNTAFDGESVLASKPAFNKVFKLISEALDQGDDVFISIRNPDALGAPH